MAGSFAAVTLTRFRSNPQKKFGQSNKLKIALKHQKNKNNIFKGIITPKDYFHLTMCNPPFHASEAEANKGTQRKWKNLGKGHSNKLNFGGQKAELWCPVCRASLYHPHD